MITFEEYKEESIPYTGLPPLSREQYYKKYMDKGITIEDSYEQLVRLSKE
jgi:hypothetical protein